MKTLSRILFAAFVVAFMFCVGVQSAQANEPIQTVVVKIEKIEKATYSEADGTFHVYTVRDANGGFWTMDFKPRKGETLAQFKKRAVGRYLIVKYIGNLETDEEIEITEKHIW